MDKIITFSFCENYIARLTDYIYRNYAKGKGDLSRLAIVFGGKRPALFLKRDLAKRIGKNYYPPRIFSIDEFIADIVKRREEMESSLDLDHCYLLYQLAKEKTPQILERREAFSQFLPWAREILSFIEQLDLENIEDKALLSIEANARMGYDVPKDINQMLEKITHLRQGYHQQLKDNKKYSRGFQYLRAAELIQEVDFEEFDQILFCNFFYFNHSEEKIIKTLFDKDKATLIFQGDERKWPILKRLAQSFQGTIKEGAQPQEPRFSLKLYSAFDGHSQVGMVREIIKKMKNLPNTVIVLPHPDPLIPLLSEVAKDIKDFNISMGYPLRRSSLYHLFEFIFQAQLSRKGSRYYSRDYLKVLRHPFIKNLKVAHNPTVTRILIHKVEEILTGKEKTRVSGSIFISLEELEGLDELYHLTSDMLKRLHIRINKKELQHVLKEIHSHALSRWEKINNFSDFASSLKMFLDILVEKSALRNYPLNLNIAKKMYELQEELMQASFNEEKFPEEEMFRIFHNKVEGAMVAFHGSPLKGLQMLGLFETRSLNFENVIVLDTNEGTLPALRIHEPLIPREVMLSLNIDRVELEEEIQRYQFMRLISSAKNVHLLYLENREKEKSRFVEELIWEEEKKKGEMNIVPILKPRFTVNTSMKEKGVPKTAAMVQMLKQHTFSASSVNMYLRDPLEFYYSYVLGLREREDLLDEPEARQIGTFIHELLEDSFKIYLNKQPKIDTAFRHRFQKIFEDRFSNTFAKAMKTDAFLVKAVLEERLQRFLEYEWRDEGRQVEEILYLEKQFVDVIPLEGGEVKFRYVVDRVDRLKDGTIMIIDYKTGSVEQMPKSIKYIETMTLSRETIRDHIRSFQLPLYYYYLSKQYAKQPINAALYNLRTMEYKKFDKENNFDRQKINALFLNALNFIMQEIFDPNVPFYPNE